VRHSYSALPKIPTQKIAIKIARVYLNVPYTTVLSCIAFV
jgi:hypothetical protein